MLRILMQHLKAGSYLWETFYDSVWNEWFRGESDCEERMIEERESKN